jgi:hypothetical protein
VINGAAVLSLRELVEAGKAKPMIERRYARRMACG